MTGIGIGIIAASLIILPFGYGSPSDYEIEKAAKEMGMVYPDQVRAVTSGAVTSGGVKGNE